MLDYLVSLTVIDCIYVFHNSGMCLLSREYPNNTLSMNKDLFCGYAAAIASFTNEVTKDKILEIVLEKYLMTFKIKCNLIIVTVSDHNVNKVRLNSTLDFLLHLFFTAYLDIIKLEVLSRNVFSPFTTTIDEILLNEGFISTNLVIQPLVRS